MKKHIKIFLISLVIVVAALVLFSMIELELSVAMVEQAKAISYVVTLAGIVSLFSWYNRKAVLVDADDVESADYINQIQNRALNFMLAINIVNAFVIALASEQSIHFMTGISLMVVLVAPIIFRTMHEKEGEKKAAAEKAAEEAENVDLSESVEEDETES